MTEKYKIAAENLAKAADIAITVFQKFPPQGWKEHYVSKEKKQITHFIDLYKEWKHNFLNPQPKFATMQSLKYDIDSIFTYFQEGHGNCVEEFWKEIKSQNLPYKRENKMVKILKRKKIKDINEYDFVIDVIVPYEQEGLITHDQVTLLNDFIAQFEAKKKK
ncbi:hypothetical protein IRZ83_13390 [Flavobacterium sp. JLP]|uniref:hypothetical protein n=1 Tax=unclassified Flavobacterium TaxID=196869 RepID=UPI00188D06ED|nr:MULTISPECIES: hypothetical protein [unclassified Flavobacterium]MBF4494234.1 hypothetical protein [Flavobacterium sp. MR2016-29]MBF4507664.1 hypothetical protein [Flavobacterium sp. JLP]